MIHTCLVKPLEPLKLYFNDPSKLVAWLRCTGLHIGHLGLQQKCSASTFHSETCCGGDGCGFILQKRMADWVDGKQVLIEGEPLVSYSVFKKFELAR